MTTTSQPDDNELTSHPDSAQLGADQGPGNSPEEDSRDMSTVMAGADDNRGGAGPHGPELGGDGPATGAGSDFDRARRAGAAGTNDPTGDVGRGQGMGHADNGDEDRGYDQSGIRGGLGSAGGREDLSDRQTDTGANPFAGGYGGGNYPQPDPETAQRIGMNSQNPTEEADKAPGENTGPTKS
ncbi:hypothetical protein [Hymenobacter ruricola]|uniref:Uncharacterized protein n=1 Tax=Hymenobacter ruricola TaxID=2791023 RepID=A0ABS0I4K5_9BACT|nr:hypothetical protein [Hymenobacter ruricola]MBF9221721.1 hypothetical protein [Hymenobacter ruricola]